jgi:hypothetical protein
MTNWWASKLGAPTQRREPLPGPPQGGTPYQPVPAGSPPPDRDRFERQFQPGTVADDLNNRYGRSWQDWEGKQGARETQTTGNCPECGSHLYFSRREGAVTTERGMMAPRAECWSCGYPNTQGAVSVSSTTGVTKPARQDEAPPPPGSLGHLRR